MSNDLQTCAIMKLNTNYIKLMIGDYRWYEFLSRVVWHDLIDPESHTQTKVPDKLQSKKNYGASHGDVGNILNHYVDELTKSFEYFELDVPVALNKTCEEVALEIMTMFYKSEYSREISPINTMSPSVNEYGMIYHSKHWHELYASQQKSVRDMEDEVQRIRELPIHFILQTYYTHPLDGTKTSNSQIYGLDQTEVMLELFKIYRDCRLLPQIYAVREIVDISHSGHIVAGWKSVPMNYNKFTKLMTEASIQNTSTLDKNIRLGILIDWAKIA